MVPALQLVCTADFVEDCLPGLETKVVGVVEAETAAGGFELLWSEAFEGALRCDRHEERGFNGAVGEAEDGGASSRGLRE